MGHSGQWLRYSVVFARLSIKYVILL
jgi:hypothetical protein